MAVFSLAAGVLLVLLVIWEGFETIILPRRVTRRFRVTRLFYRYTWLVWAAASRRFPPGRRQETFLSYYGPLSLLTLLVVWAFGLILGFGMAQWGVHSLAGSLGQESHLLPDLYLSATTFFTLGLGDVVPRAPAARLLTSIEAGTGFGFLALLFAYVPALNQSFSRREVSISLLDARAGSPPTAGEILRRHAHEPGLSALQHLLHEWEGWSAEFLEGQLSYPVLAYFRSQHDNQSWLSALVAVLDTCALLMVGVEGPCARQAGLTFAMARHALVDLSVVFGVRPSGPVRDRLPPERFSALCGALTQAGLELRERGEPELGELRRLYEPYVQPLASYFRMAVPPWCPEASFRDNWQMSAWEAGEIPAGRMKRGQL
ncbi:MAG: two pore domain potassium channel family protein [Deltaproteobacteria bacterium]|nr:two pore domain potassium channel family protein [Deltaproteobacteria bacterium]